MTFGLLGLAAGLFILFEWNRFEIHKEIKYIQEPAYNQEVWGQLKSDDINARGISFMMDDTHIDADIYIDGDLQLLVAKEDIRDCFSCAVHMYPQENMLKIQKKDIVLQFPLQEACYYVNGERIEDGRALTMIGEQCYVPLGVLTEQFLCEYTWDAQSNTVSVTNNWTEPITPSHYSLQETGRDTVIKNQGTLGTCWAVAALSALETTLKPEENILFATDHMSIRNSFYLSQNDGGEYTMSMAYLLGWQGPVLESDDPYGDKLSPVGLGAVKHVQEVRVLKDKNIDKIKEHVFYYGAVQSSIYTSLRSENSRSAYYNKKEAAYCYIGDEPQNHEIIIIGWDDAYPKENFNIDVEGDGAFICQNSWGTGFGHDGIFYVSYYDTHIGSQGVVYTRVENKDNYDHIYQTDLCGWAGQLGYNSDTAFFANAFTAQSQEQVRAAGFYATDKDTEYEVYFVSDFTNASSLENRVMVASGKCSEAGFYTVSFEYAQTVVEGQRFAVVIKLMTPGSVHPVAVEYAADDTTRNVDLSDGEGYISMYGTEWSNVESEQNCNVCMKVYTDSEEEGEENEKDNICNRK